jgi:capsule biosynthesis phosphatase
MEKSTFVIDVDKTICKASKAEGSDAYDYVNALPIQPVIHRIQDLKQKGHTVILHSSRGMRTYRGDREMIEANVRPIMEAWLHKHNVPYDDLVLGKPWGPNVYYIDDRCVSPFDFAFKTDFEAVVHQNTLTL